MREGEDEHRKTRRGAFNRPMKKFGDLISFDYLDLDKSSLDLVPVLDYKVVVVRDRFTGMIAGYSSRTGETDQVVVPETFHWEAQSITALL